MSELSVHLCGEGISFSQKGKLVGKISGDQINPEALELFVKQNYQLQGTVGYQNFLCGVLAGCSLLLGVVPEADTETSTIEAAGAADAQTAADESAGVATAVADKSAIDQPTT